MTKNQKPGLFLPFFVRWWGAGQGEVLAREWEQLFSYVTHCINLIHIALRLHEDIP